MRMQGSVSDSETVLFVCNLVWGQESQMKALKDTVHICFSAVLHNQPSSSHRFPTSPTHLFRYSSLINSSRVTFQQPHAKVIQNSLQSSFILFNVFQKDELDIVKYNLRNKHLKIKTILQH